MIDEATNDNNQMDQYYNNKSKSSFFRTKQNKNHIDTRRSSSVKQNENSQNKLEKYNPKDSKNNMSS